jgi:hypothetical protein
MGAAEAVVPKRLRGDGDSAKVVAREWRRRISHTVGWQSAVGDQRPAIERAVQRGITCDVLVSRRRQQLGQRSIGGPRVALARGRVALARGGVALGKFTFSAQAPERAGYDRFP